MRQENQNNVNDNANDNVPDADPAYVQYRGRHLATMDPAVVAVLEAAYEADVAAEEAGLARIQDRVLDGFPNFLAVCEVPPIYSPDQKRWPELALMGTLTPEEVLDNDDDGERSWDFTIRMQSDHARDPFTPKEGSVSSRIGLENDFRSQSHGLELSEIRGYGKTLQEAASRVTTVLDALEEDAARLLRSIARVRKALECRHPVVPKDPAPES